MFTKNKGKTKRAAAVLLAALALSSVSTAFSSSYAAENAGAETSGIAKSDTGGNIGTDFALAGNATYKEGDSSVLADPSGTVATLRHPGASSFEVGNKMLTMRGSDGVKPSVAFPVSLGGKDLAGHMAELSVRYDQSVPLAAGTELYLLNVVGRDASGAEVSFVPLKLTSSGYISCYNGNGYVTTSAYLSDKQWKKAAVAFKTGENGLKCDIYLLDTIVAENVSVPVNFASVEEIRTLEVAGNGCPLTAQLNYLWFTEGDEPITGGMPTVPKEEINASADFSGIPENTSVFDLYSTDDFRLRTYGNPAAFLLRGKHPYLSLAFTGFSPYLDIYSKSPAYGRSQVAEISLSVGKGWNAEAELLSLFANDPSGITIRKNFLRINNRGDLQLSDGTSLATLDEQFTVISAVIYYDRKTVDVYVDGIPVASGVSLGTGGGFDGLAGIRAFSCVSGSGTLNVDYAVMYDGILPASDGGAERIPVYEHSFDNAGNDAPLAPLEPNGDLFVLTDSGDDRRLETRKVASTSPSSVSLPVTLGSVPLYAEFDFSFSALSDKLSLVSLYGNSGLLTEFCYIERDGWLCSQNGGEVNKLKRLESGKEYRLYAVIDPENGIYGVYIDGEPVLPLGVLPAATASQATRLVMASCVSNGKTVVTLDDIFVYRAVSPLRVTLGIPEIACRLSVEKTGAVLVTWDDLGPGAGYTVMRATSVYATPQKISDVIRGKTSFTDPNVEDDKTYYYRVCVTMKRGGEEIYYGEDNELGSITVKIPDSAYRLDTPAGHLPAYTASEILHEDFSSIGLSSSVSLYSQYCTHDPEAGVIKILNPSDSTTVPYFAIEGLKQKVANIIDFEMTYTRPKNSMTLAAVYDGLTPIATLAKIKDNVLTDANGTKLMTLSEGKTYRVTVWLDMKCTRAALFIDGICVAEEIYIGSFSTPEGRYTLRLCAVTGENVLTADELCVLETRVFLNAYTTPALSPVANVSDNSVSLSWTAFKGCSNYTVWSSSSENGTYTVLAESPDQSFINLGQLNSSKYYKVTYTFDTLGVELTVPLSSPAPAEYIPPETAAVIPPFLDFTKSSTVETFILSLVALACIVAVIVPGSVSHRKKN